MIELQSLLRGTLLTVSVPEAAPPEFPRIILSSEDTIVGLGFNRLEVTVRPPDHIKEDYASSAEFAQRKTYPIVEAISKLVNYEWAGVISVGEYPLASGEVSGLKVVTPIFDRLVNIPRNGKDLASFQLQYGYKQQDLFKNFTIAGYENRNIDIKIDAQEGQEVVPITVDLSKYPVSGSGLQITADINNKEAPKRSKVIKDITQMFKEQITTHATLAKELNLEGLVS